MNPEGSANTNTYIKWGTDPNLVYFSTTSVQYPVTNFSSQSFTWSLSGLQSNTTYYFQMVLYNGSNGAYQYGAILNFTTLVGHRQ